MRTLLEFAHCPALQMGFRTWDPKDRSSDRRWDESVGQPAGMLAKLPWRREIDYRASGLVGPVARSGGVLMSLKFSTVLNSMLNSPKFCHR